MILAENQSKTKTPSASDEDFAIQPFWHVKDSINNAFVDFQNDVGVKDIKLAHREGFRSVEHLKALFNPWHGN